MFRRFVNHSISRIRYRVGALVMGNQLNTKYANARKRGYRDGYQHGRGDGNREGETKGHEEGYRRGTIDGFADGVTHGQQLGANEGYQRGYEDAKTILEIVDRRIPPDNRHLDESIYGPTLFNVTPLMATEMRRQVSSAVKRRLVAPQLKINGT